MAHRADQLCLSSALEIARLVDMVRREWGLDSVTVMMTQFISVAIFTLMEDLPSPTSRAAFIELCVAARSFSRRWTLGKSMLRLVQLTAREMRISLPRETAVLFEDFESRTWKPTTERKRLGNVFSSSAAMTMPPAGLGAGPGPGAASSPSPSSSSSSSFKKDKSKMSEMLVLDQLLDHWGDDVLISSSRIPHPPLPHEAARSRGALQKRTGKRSRELAQDDMADARFSEKQIERER